MIKCFVLTSYILLNTQYLPEHVDAGLPHGGLQDAGQELRDGATNLCAPPAQGLQEHAALVLVHSVKTLEL